MDWRSMVQEEMARRRWRYADLAREVGASDAVVTRWFNWQQNVPTKPQYIARLAAFLHLDVGELSRLLGHLPFQERPEAEAAPEDPEMVYVLDRVREILRENYQPADWPRVTNLWRQMAELSSPHYSGTARAQESQDRDSHADTTTGDAPQSRVHCGHLPTESRTSVLFPLLTSRIPVLA